ncbi:MAG: hypothetical protein CVT98_07080 [Bacteroidetes bacterium HGW-Bacteroidetes-15]|nr:MAG: hypothetical protein CVT98_07080 [Bacteroidetes bacterium HGW-Bacteroidetes-15]
MKRIYLTFISLFLLSTLFASELILIQVKSFQEVKQLFDDQSKKIHFYNDDFVIATTNSGANENDLLLDKNPWEANQSYYIVYLDNSVDKSRYLTQLDPIANILFDDSDFLVVSINEQKSGQLPPAKNDGMVRIHNTSAKLPSYSLSEYVSTPTQTDPFVVELLNEVSNTNITTTVQHLEDYGTRNAYASQSSEAQNWISSQFDDLGLDVEIMDFYMPGGSASDNVIAKQIGTTYPNEFVVVGGHYDSYSSSGAAPGADDNASGTAAVLEIARVLSSHDFERSIIYCAFSGEEYGLYGSAAYANRSSQQGMNILGYFNLDMIGYLEPGGTMMTSLVYPQSAKELADFYTAICSLYLPSFVIQPGTLSGANSDHYSFNMNGFMGIFPFENINAYSPYIHTSNDKVGTSYNNEAQAGVFTKASLASVATIAKSGFTGVPISSEFFGIYPNPANDQITIQLKTEVRVKLDVFNLMGQLVHSQHITNNEEINITNWAKDIYVFRVVTPNGIAVKKVIKH